MRMHGISYIIIKTLKMYSGAKWQRIKLDERQPEDMLRQMQWV